MNKVIALILSMGFPILGLSSSNIEVEFSGILVNKTCQLAASSLNQHVKIENIRLKSINDSLTSHITPFLITIEKCSPADLHKMVKITWKSPKLVSVEGKYYLETTGNSGVVLGLVDKQGMLMDWDQSVEVTPVSVVDGEQQLEFGVLVRKGQSSEAKYGHFSGSATFSLEYE